MLRAVVGVAALTALATLLVGCAGDSSAQRDQPAPNVTGFATPGFGRLPEYPGSRPVSGAAKNDGGVITRSFTVEGATPEEIVLYFVRKLRPLGWKLTSAVPATDPSIDRRDVWTKQRRHLVVSSGPAPAAGSGSAAVGTLTQYSLVLYPRGVTP
jgi:hypothetical protein